jgi:hypothetical protein
MLSLSAQRPAKHIVMRVAARKAGAAEDVCERVAMSPALLREQLTGPQLLKQQIYYPQVAVLAVLYLFHYDNSATPHQHVRGAAASRWQLHHAVAFRGVEGHRKVYWQPSLGGRSALGSAQHAGACCSPCYIHCSARGCLLICRLSALPCST